MSQLFVAELNENGDVAWVWHRRPGGRIARPLAPSATVETGPEGVEYYGAPRERIEAWMADRLIQLEPAGDAPADRR